MCVHVCACVCVCVCVCVNECLIIFSFFSSYSSTSIYRKWALSIPLRELVLIQPFALRDCFYRNLWTQ